MDMTLYEITEELQPIMQRLYENGGEIDEETERLFDTMVDLRKEKIEACIAAINELSLMAEGAKEEAKRLKKRYKALENSAKSLKDYVAHEMRRQGVEAVETKLGKFRWQEHHTRPVRLRDGLEAEDLPERFQRSYTRISADSSALREALESGDEEALEVAELGEASIYGRIY